MLSEHRYLYGEHKPVTRVGPSGHIFDTIWDSGNIVCDIYTRSGGDPILDVGAALLPGVPAGIGNIDDAVCKN